MQLSFHIVTYATYSSLTKPLRYINQYISDVLTENNVQIFLDEIEIYFVYPRHIIPKEIANPESEEKWKNWYNKLPYTRFSNKRKKITLTVQFPELSDIEGKSSTEIAMLVIDKLPDTLLLIKPKIRSGEVFDFVLLFDVLQSIKASITDQFLEEMHSSYQKKQEQLVCEMNRADREQRLKTETENKRLIRDIRLIYHIEGWEIGKFRPDDMTICDKIVGKLREVKFRCPQYDHLYISVAETYDKALLNAGRGEKWFVYGLAVLNNPDEFDNLSKREKRICIFNLIKMGLLDIANIDRLDMKTLIRVLDEVEQSL